MTVIIACVTILLLCSESNDVPLRLGEGESDESLLSLSFCPFAPKTLVAECLDEEPVHVQTGDKEKKSRR